LCERYNLHKKDTILELNTISKLRGPVPNVIENVARYCISQIAAEKWSLASVLLLNFKGCLSVSKIIIKVALLLV
jgi:hypothetical protein